ncbi:MAG TPA: NAD-binding protein [Nocardioides sp.]|jgi:voltage-gated potassium channel Kch|uniref:NAD-binding protein n=1 Tax=Nocardioides sp. TaxID=35761 RepID=UPI002E334EE8|nr:NAD-binding protein [Nocardioides sp.]HEX3931526.1 NAD-binding protein [Nocardioides sp.]
MSILVIGQTPLSRRLCHEIAARGDEVDHLVEPGDQELMAAIGRSPDAVAVVVHDDVQALRYALALAHLDPELRIVVTIFDRTIADRVRALLPQAVVTSAADIAAASLAGPCLGADVMAAWEAGGQEHQVLSAGSGRVHRTTPLRSPGLRGWPPTLAVPLLHDLGARLLLGGFLGLLAVLVTDFAWLTLAGGHGVLVSLLESARVVATVGPGPSAGSAAYAVFTALAMLATVGFTALFTAGLVDRMLEPRLVTLFGARRAPRRDHVIVVGMGQVGIRLCTELRRLKVPVVGVERDESAAQLHVARALRIPVVVGHGADRQVLERLGLRRALALAAVGSDEYDNIAVAIAANAIAPTRRVVMRAGEQEAIAETRSLLPLGVTRDVLGIASRSIGDALRDVGPEASATVLVGRTRERTACEHGVGHGVA